MFLFAQPLRGLRVVTKAHQFVHVSYVNVFFSEGDSERPPHAAYENFPFLRAASMLRIAKHHDFPRSGTGQKNISIRRHRQPARPLEICRKYIQAKSRWHRGQKTRRSFFATGPIAAELVANGTGSFGFWPCVTCDDAR